MQSETTDPRATAAPEAAHQPPARTFPELMEMLAGTGGQALAVVDDTEEVGFFELADRARALAGVLAGAGIGRGDRVGLLDGNGARWLEIFYATAITGATLVPFSTWATRDELDFLVDDADCKLLFASGDFHGRDFNADIAKTGAGERTERIVLEGGARDGAVAFDVFLRGDAGDPGPGPEADDDALILYTSGSTSRPKGVRLTQAGTIANGFHIGTRMGLGPEDRVFVPVPLFWAYGGCNALPAVMSHGATLVMPSRFEAGQALRMIEERKCTAIYTLPTITNALLDHDDFAAAKVESLRTGLTIGSPEDFRLAQETLGVSEICNIYGTTETYGNCAVTWHYWPEERRARCQGEMLPGQDVRFRDPEGPDTMPPGETGLAEVRGRISPGYFGQSREEGAEAFTDDGFYRTGDMGHLDDQGAFCFVGRASEMIKRAGINVSPAEVEDALLRHPDVAAAAVVGTPDPKRGELIVGFVTANRPDIDRDELIAHCRTLLSKYKVPDRIEVVDKLPLTSTGKLQRKAVKEMARELGGDGA